MRLGSFLSYSKFLGGTLKRLTLKDGEEVFGKCAAGKHRAAARLFGRFYEVGVHMRAVAHGGYGSEGAIGHEVAQ